jgi:arylsulfatase A-like enzyme
MTPQKSLILITVDCLRADHCGFMGYTRPTTPFLDALANESFVFPSAIAAGVPTYYSLPAIVASRYPLALGREVIGIAPEEETLASTCRRGGYATAFFGAGNPYISPRFGYDTGFDVFRDCLDDSVPPHAESFVRKPASWAGNLNRLFAHASQRIPAIRPAYEELYFRYCQHQTAPARSLDVLRRFPSAEVMVDQARSWLASIAGKPFFLWLHLMDPHSPYYPTEKALQLFGNDSITATRARYLNACWNRSDLESKRLRRYRDSIIALYDSAIRWVDAQVSRLVDSLRRLKLWENCIFALTADHGEEFLEHERRFHAPGLAEELIHVPLLLRVPSEKKRAVAESPFSLLHLSPTLLAAAEVAAPRGFHGRNFWKHVREGTSWSDPAISECVTGCTNPYQQEQRRGARLLAVRESRYKLVMNFENGVEQLFDLEADPAERSPLPGSAAKVDRRRLLEAALAHVECSATRQTSRSYLRTQMRDIHVNNRPAAEAASLSAAC